MHYTLALRLILSFIILGGFTLRYRRAGDSLTGKSARLVHFALVSLVLYAGAALVSIGAIRASSLGLTAIGTLVAMALVEIGLGRLNRLKPVRI